MKHSHKSQLSYCIGKGRYICTVLSICMTCLVFKGCVPENISLPGSSSNTSGDTPSDTIVAPGVTVPEAFVNYFSKGITFDFTADEVKVVFKIDKDWMLEVVGVDGSDASWCTLDTDLGISGLHRVKVSAKENLSRDFRSARIVLSSLDASQIADIAVIQECPTVRVTKKTDSISYEKATINVEVEANIAYEYEILDADWLHKSSHTTRELSAHNVAFDVDENKTTKPREARVRFYNSEYKVSDTITLIQIGCPSLQISVPDGYANYFAEPLSFEHTANEATVCFQATANWKIQVLGDDGKKTSWCSVEPASGISGQHEVVVRVEKNTSITPRSAKIQYLSLDAEKVAEILVVQDFPTIQLANKKNNVSYEATTINVEVRSNVDFKHEVLDANWVYESANTTRELDSHNVTFTVEENLSLKPREARIRFYSAENGAADTLILMQGCIEPDISVPEGYENYFVKGISFDYASAETKVVFETNIHWSLQVVQASWCSCSPVSGTPGRYEVTVCVEENTTSIPRSAKIQIMSVDASVVAEIIVQQTVNPNIKSDVNAVDLGLSVKWAPYNVGANSPEEFGSYFAWGETEEKEDYSRSTYLYYQNDSYINIDSDISGTSYDAAVCQWGGGWRMPTMEELEELCNKCTWSWSSINGTSGYKVSGPNGNSIFLPAAGYRYKTTVYNSGTIGYYWTGTLGDSSDRAHGLIHSNKNSRELYQGLRYNGHVIRPVKE